MSESDGPDTETLGWSRLAPPEQPSVPGYEIIGLLGSGGMGRVYRARHLGLGRIVALKMALAGSDAGLRTRFRQEARAVARLQHPNIAQVFEAGEVDGQPYFAMECVEGGTLTRRLAGKPQDPHHAAALVEKLARAMQFSHEHGILHRDLKPSNVLLTGAESESLAEMNPKITDFGLAKCLAEDSHLTRTGEVLGTPSYMAPEQASGAVGHQGPPVDIYALGAILYEALTGRPPFQAPDPFQTVRMVLSMDPVTPRSLQPQVPRDLQTICLKCLEKSPQRRYPTALALAEDLRRFREGLPIEARAVRPWQRLAKWARRKPVLAALLVVVAAAVVAQSVSFFRLRSAHAQLETAFHEKDLSLDLARSVVDNLVRMSEDLAPVPHAEHLRQTSLEQARELYERLAALRPRNAGDQEHIAEAQGRLGQIYQALGRLDDAEAAHRKALTAFTDLHREAPDEPAHRRNLAGTLNNLAGLDRHRGQTTEAERLAREALDVIDPLVRGRDDDAAALQIAGTLHNLLAVLCAIDKNFAGAIEEHKNALEVRGKLVALSPNRPDLRGEAAASHSNLAAVLMLQKRPAEAVGELYQAEKLLTDLAAPQQRFYLGQVQGNLAIARELLGQDAAALAAHRKALATFRSLAADFSAVSEYRHMLGRQLVNLARHLGPRGRFVEAMPYLKEAIPILETLTKQVPDAVAYRTDLSIARQCMSFAEADLRDAAKGKK